MVEVAVSAHRREGEANKALLDLVVLVLRVPKPDVHIFKGVRSRDKTVTVQQPREVFGEKAIKKALALLKEAIDS